MLCFVVIEACSKGIKLVKTDSLNIGRDWRELQETNDSFIVLDGNGLIVSCNDQAKKTLFDHHVGTSTTQVLNCFWSEAEQRTVHFSEFKKIVGKKIKLLFSPNYYESYRVSVLVEAFCFSNQSFCSLTIQKEPEFFSVNDVSQSSLMAQALSAALKNDQLEVHYQPQINTFDHSLYGVEVLARWTSKEFGRVAPDEFIEIAEAFGFIATLDLCILRQACQQLADWRKQDINLPLIAVNFSPLTFHSPDLINTIKFILKQNGMSPSDLVLEVTENKKIILDDQLIGVIDDLYSMGIQISLDDFGTGHSNLKRLLQIPVSQLKLDRSFVMGLPQTISKELSETIFSLSQKVNAVSIAEGVETEQQLSTLKELGYKVVQGYFFAPPLSRVNFEAWFASNF